MQIHAKTNSGSTALHLAALGNHVDVIKVLVEKGAEVNALDNKGGTPFVWAKHIDSQVCLAKLGANGDAAAQLLLKMKSPTPLSQNSRGYFGVGNSAQRRMLELARAVLLFGVVAIAVVYFAWWVEMMRRDKENAYTKPYNRR